MLFPSSVLCFLEAVRKQNITHAADALYMSRQAVSKQILRLEEELGTQLFDRSTGKLIITAAGRMYYDFFTSTMDRWKAVQADVRALNGQEKLVRIGFLKGINIEEQIFQLIDECSREDRGLRFIWERLEPFELSECLLSGRLDIIFSFEPELHSADIEKLTFIESCFCAAISELHPQFESIKKLSDFESCVFLTWKLEHLPESEPTGGFAELCAKCGIRVKDVARLPNMDSVETGVEMGGGATLCSQHDKLCSKPRIRVFPTEMRSDIEVAWRAEETNPNVTGMVERIKKKLSSKR